jgi:hypothetical protein
MSSNAVASGDNVFADRAERWIARLGVIMLAAGLVSAVALAVTASSFHPEVWSTCAFVTGVIAVTDAMIGVLLGPLAGRLGGQYLMSRCRSSTSSSPRTSCSTPRHLLGCSGAHARCAAGLGGRSLRCRLRCDHGLLPAATLPVGLTAPPVAVLHHPAASRI